MGVFDRVLEQTGGNEARGVGHVYPEDSAHLVRDSAHALIIPFTGIGRCTADDELGLAFEGLALHFVVVYPAGFGVETIGYRVIQQAAGVDGRAVGEVTAHGEVQTHEGISGFEDGHGHGHVGLGAGVRLHIGIFGIEEGAEPVDGQLLDLVHHLATAVIALAGIAFRILVGAHGAHGCENLLGHIVFGSNQFQTGRLAFLLLLDEVKYLKIVFHVKYMKEYLLPSDGIPLLERIHKYTLFCWKSLTFVPVCRTSW